MVRFKLEVTERNDSNYVESKKGPDRCSTGGGPDLASPTIRGRGDVETFFEAVRERRYGSIPRTKRYVRYGKIGVPQQLPSCRESPVNKILNGRLVQRVFEPSRKLGARHTGRLGERSQCPIAIQLLVDRLERRRQLGSTMARMNGLP